MNISEFLETSIKLSWIVAAEATKSVGKGQTMSGRKGIVMGLAN